MNNCEDALKNGNANGPFRSLGDYFKHITEEVGVERSVYVMDFADALWKVQLWKENLPNIRPFYAVKTNSDRTLLRLLATIDFSFDCASQGEIRMVLEAGSRPDRIIFAHPVKTPGALRYAREAGVELLTFDDAEELDKVREHHPHAKLVLRLMPQNVKCSFDLSQKFGCPAEKAVPLLKRAKELQLNVIGISFHVGGLCQTASSYVSTIRTSREVFDAAEQMGFRFSLLDIGGGFKGAEGTEHTFLQVSKEIKTALKDYSFEENVELISEPGTFFVSSAVKLVTGIIGTKNVTPETKNDEDKPLEKLYYMNESVWGSFFMGFHKYDVYPKPLLEEEQLRKRRVLRSRIWGHTCCGDDLVVREMSLPELRVGECLVWHNVGAYSRGICSTFCGMPLPHTRHVFANRTRFNFKNLTTNDLKNFILQACEVVG